MFWREGDNVSSIATAIRDILAVTNTISYITQRTNAIGDLVEGAFRENRVEFTEIEKQQWKLANEMIVKRMEILSRRLSE